MTYFAGYGGPDAPAPPLVTPPTPDLTRTLENLNAVIQGGIQSYYGTRAQIAQAKANEAIAKAQYRGDVYQATTGLPSPGVLLMGGAVLTAIVLLSRSGGRR